MRYATKKRVGLAAAVLGLVLGSAGRSEATFALQMFQASGTFSDGSILGGSLFISELGPLSSVFPDVLAPLTITGGPVIGTAVFDTISSSSQGQITPSTYEVVVTGSAGTLTLEIEDGGSLANYNGGLLNSYNGIAFTPDPTAPPTSYSLTSADPPLRSGSLSPAAAAPEPSTIVMAATACLIGVAYAWLRQERAATA